MSEFSIVVALLAKEGKETELRRDLAALVEQSRKEDGNLRYELFVDQSNPRRFVFVERWASPEARNKHHTQSDHIRDFHAHGVGNVETTEVAYFLDQVA